MSLKHCEPLVKHETLIKHCETSWNTLTLAVWCTNISARCGDINAWRGDIGARWDDIGAWRRVSDNISDCGVGITPQMCNRVTNPWHMGIVDPIKGCTEINLHDPSLLQTLQCTLQCIWDMHKSASQIQTFPISKLCDWKHTTTFHKSSKTNWHQALKHLWQY